MTASEQGVARNRPGSLPRPDPVDSATARAVRAIEALPRRWCGALLVALLAGSWAVGILLGGAGRVAPHWFYVPILLAACRFRFLGVALTAAVAGLVAGPLLPLSVENGTAQAASDWISRAVFFVLIGLGMAAVIRGFRAALAREAVIAERERALAEQQSAILECVSHEFRTPLTVMSGALQTLTDPALDPTLVPRFLGMATDATRRLEGLVAVVVAAAGEQTGAVTAGPQEVETAHLCTTAVADLPDRESIERVRLDASPSRTRLGGDPRLLQFAIRAVTENALRFSDDVPVDVQCEVGPSTLVVTIADRGPGVPAEIGAQVFAPFRRGSPSAGTRPGGLGLGLYAARAAVERLGGTMDLQPRAGGGTVVTIRVPTVPSADPR